MSQAPSRKMDSFLLALLKRLVDDDDSTRQEISQTIYRLGHHWPEYVLLTCRHYLWQRVWLPDIQSTIILNSMEMIIKDNLSLIRQPVAESLITLASLRMTTLIEEHRQSQEAACNLMVAIGLRFLQEVLSVTLEDMKKGFPSHVYMVKALIRLSTVNIHGMVPLMEHILGIMIPVLMEVTSDYNQSVSAAALGAFSKNILIYVDTVAKCPQPTVTKESFTSHMNTAYDLFFNKWLEKEESPLNITIIEALGYITSLMPKDSLEVELPRLIPEILALYEVQSEHFAITQSLCHIVTTATDMGSQSLRTQMEGLLNNLHEQLCVLVNSNDQLAAENHNQILGCFTVLAQDHANSLMEFLLPQLEPNNPQTRLGTLSVLKHLIRAVPSQLERRKAQIVAGLKPTLLDNSNNVKKLIVETIGAMAHEGYLDLEGGKIMVEFIMQQYVLSTDSGNPIPLGDDVNQVTHKDLSAICEVMMSALTALDHMEDVLWPFLLHFMTLPQYTKGLTMVSKCLTQLAKKKLQAGDEKYFLIYKENANLPKPQALLTRLLIIACCPYEGEGRGSAVLRLLQAVSLNIHAAIVRLWEEEIPLLVNDLVESSGKTLPQHEWEEKLILLLAQTLRIIDDERWTCQLSEEINQQIISSHSYPQQKGFLYKCLGMVLHHSDIKDIKKEIQQMLQSAQHKEAVEREGVAVGIGFCSITNFEATFSSLVDYSNLNLLKKTRSFLHVLKDESDLEVDNAKSTLALCYGYLALNAPPDLILSRIENHILPVLSDQLSQLGQMEKEEFKDSTLTMSLIKTVTLIARAMLSSTQTLLLNFTRKRELLKYMQQLIKAEPSGLLQTPIRQLAMNACLHLVQLNPRSNEADNCQLIKSCLSSIFSLVPVDPSQGQEETPVNPEGGETLYTESMTTLHCLLKHILLQNLSPEGLKSIYEHVEKWITSPRDYERERAVDTTSELLKFYWQELDVENVMAPINSGAVVGRLLPRCADPVLPIRQRALDSLHILLKVQACYEHLNPDEQNEQEETLKRIGQRLANTDSSVLFQGCTDLAKLISKHLPHDQLSNLLFMLFEGLVDHHPSCSNTAAVIMKAVVKRRGPELEDQVSETLKVLHLQMQAITQKEVTLTVLETITLLTSQHLPTTVRCLLRFPAPLDQCTSAIWRSIAMKPQLATSALKQLMQYMNKSVPSNERSHPVRADESPDPLTVICALYEVVSEPESAEAVNTLYSDLFSALLIHLGSCIYANLPYDFIPHCELRQTEHQSPTPTCKSRALCLCSVKTLRTMLNRAQNEVVVNFIQEKGGWDLMLDPDTYHEGIALLARTMGFSNERQLIGIVVDLAPVLLTSQEGQRATVAAFFAELLTCSFISHVRLTNILVNSLLSCLFHSTMAVRLLCVRGLGNIPIGVPRVMERYSSDLLAAMTAILESKEYHEEHLMIEVTSTLSKLLDQLSVNAVGPFCIDIAKGIRHFFEAKSIQIRAAAFTVFGTLAKCGHGHSRVSFMEEIHLSLVSLLLHLNDKSEEVHGACLLTLCSVAPYMGSQRVCAIIQEQSRGGSLKYEEFLNILSLQLIKDFPRRIDTYIKCCMSFRHMGPRLRGDAAFLSAVLSQSPEEPAQRSSWIEKLSCIRIQH
ncbi:maestro heat-like repeat-containing protein family member 1 [Heptranchias perlo]|uniref:maestro heat-like repeat-containing protein family member 1 n=1 Tax=Heptranchias perlo TaxID=212740 RepID=UPI003559F9C9